MKQLTFTTPWDLSVQALAREETNDTNTLISCIQEDEYEVARLPDKGVAIDIGAHIGGCTLTLASKGLHVIAVEMLPENVDILRRNINLNIFDAEILAAAVVGEAKDKITAYYADPSSESGRVHEFIGTTVTDKYIAGTNQHGKSIEVPTITLEHLLKRVKVCEFLKIDVEGSEWEIIGNTPAASLKKIKRLAVEIEGLDKEVSTGDFLKLLPEGFKDVSKEYFPKWSDPGMIIHGYFENLDE